jgi:BirA family biotin operon repressor/biotin-[acetyl-CoA-carboxylase] ligase
VIPFAGGDLDPRAWRVFENLVTMEETTSSNDLGREMIELYFTEEQRLRDSVLVAAAQSGARGRKGTWVAPAGRGIYLTFLHAAPAGEPLSLVPIAVGRWIRDVLAESAGLEAALKWPNDVYARGRKLAGILAESRTQGDETYVAVGIGLNVLGSAESLGVAGATTVEEETGRRPDIAALLQALLDRFDAGFAAAGWDAEVGLWERTALHRPGDPMTVRRDGEELSGEYRGLTREGFLRLATPAGETVVSHGELARW